MRPKKHLGQHFLFDPRILGRIAAALPAGEGAAVLEIGPGKGTLTAALVERGFRVTAIERDRDLVPELAARFPGVRLIHGDALKEDWSRAVERAAGEPWFVIGNIPYNITTPLIDRALTPPRPQTVVFLIQREVADRLAAEPGTSAYGALTVGVQAAARVERLFTVPAGAFRPPPEVESAVVRLTPLARPVVAEGATVAFRQLVVSLFGARRKQLARGLRTVTGWGADRVEQVLRGAGLDPTHRPETLSVADFGRLFDAMR
jgi:16S rRNA (adenine1518-N6/adenine1519-N6)-dimethyltransferase